MRIPSLNEVTSLLGAGIAEAKNGVRNRTRKTLNAALEAERVGQRRASMIVVIERELRRRDRLRAKPDFCGGCGVQRVPKHTMIACPSCGAWDHL
jgi:lipopolysaccharide biosynthesis regulator YciM